MEPSPPPLEHLTPHDLVTYSRCPLEMVLHQSRRQAERTGATWPPAARLDLVAQRHSPLLAPPTAHLNVVEGRLDVGLTDRLVYADEGERGLPVLFPPDRIVPDARLRVHGANLQDDAWGLSGRPDFVIRRTNGALVPVEYKATHLFRDYHSWHGRTFDVIQAIAECRLVHAATGERPPSGVVLYGDAANDGDREGWVEVPYGDAEEHWLLYALKQVRSDRDRAPVPSIHTCPSCEANRENACSFRAAPWSNGSVLVAAVK